MSTKRSASVPRPGPTTLRRELCALALAAFGPVVVLLVLYGANVPLGCPDRFTYLYSPYVYRRLSVIGIPLLAGLTTGIAIALLATRRATLRALGYVLVGGAAAVLAWWTYIAPPDHVKQHMFNVHSPSHDGAFVEEAVGIEDVRRYLRNFPQRAATPVAAMRGTRVISNLPGTTLLALGIARLFERYPVLEATTLGPIELDVPPPIRHSTAVGVALFETLTVIWVLALPVLFAIGRLWLAPPVAAAYACLCVFSPAALLFVPGKDPAQLLSASAVILLWLLAWRRGWTWAAILSGVTLAGALAVSLVHAWIALIALAATLHAERDAAIRRRLLRWTVPLSVAGLGLATVVLWWVADFNLVTSLRAVAASQARVTRGAGAMPFAWQMLGVPLFLMFMGAGPWYLGLRRLFDRAPRESQNAAPVLAARFGRALLLTTGVVLLATVGFTNLETPRLWLPFLPLLTLGLLLIDSPLRWSTNRRIGLLATLVALHFAAAALQWSVLDPREAETRLVEERFYH